MQGPVELQIYANFENMYANFGKLVPFFFVIALCDVHACLNCADFILHVQLCSVYIKHSVYSCCLYACSIYL